ncbi:HNH endonuclease signature motif containing protein [Trujillonella humicola]|uniref:HNH endonuclease signature motif containing protein n=1 Tax=Trujillonella humicola TaxID=3383699 RepID=UPI0039066C4D
MAGVREFAVGVTVVPLAAPPERDVEPLPTDPGWVPETLPEMLPPRRSSAQEAALLQQITAAEAMLAGLRVRAVLGLAAARPDPRHTHGDDEQRRPGEPEGVSEFFADELATVLACSRTAAGKLVDRSATLAEKLPATLAALDAGTLDWPRARVLADQLGWKARGVDPAVIAEVEAAVLPAAAELSIRQLEAAVRHELTARDAAAADRRRAQAEAGCDVTVRPLGDGVSELVARMPHELAVACRRTADADARAATTAGDPRPLGVLRAGALADRILQPGADRTPVTATLTVDVPLAALTAALTVEEFLAAGGPVPAAFTRGAVPAPTAEVDGEPITATHLRRLLADLDAIGLRAPAQGALRYAFTDTDGRLLAVATDTELRAAAARGCPTHPHTCCGCPILTTPPAVHRYRPSAAQVRYLHTRDRTCRHPGCANRAVWADADHVIPHAAGGPTACHNLCCLCRRHHRLKTHAGGWTYQLAPDGTLTVTTPSGVTRTSRPHRRRRADTHRRSRAPGSDPPLLPLTGTRVLTGPPLPGAEPPDEDPPPF